jgi:hypothetical protein
MVPKRVIDRFNRTIGKFQQVLAVAKDRDVNESDTVAIIKDILAEVFGYNKYLELTGELAQRGTFCDIAIKLNNKVEYLIEAKAIGLDLKENHLRQAIEYGSVNGIPWVILTNGIIWQIYKIRFEKPVAHDRICQIDFANLDPKNEEHQERLFIVCKEGLVKDARENFHVKMQIVNKFLLGAFILNEEILNVLRREIRKFSEGVSVSSEDITKVLENEVLKRDVVEGEEALKAQSRVRRFYGKAARRTRESEERKADEEEKTTGSSTSPDSPEQKPD